MLEVRPGLLLGSMGDALAVFTRVPSLVARYHVTHVLSLCNDPPEWTTDRQPATGGSGGEWKDVEDEEAEEDKPAEVKPTEKLEENGEDGSERAGSYGGQQKRRKKKRKGQVELPKWRKFIEVADMPKSDLLHHFEECCQFIREGRERGTVLVHCEHGVSRSVTVVLAYLMWSEGRSLKILYQELKEKRPEIRPNSGFMDQLRLWEEMGCRVKDSNKKYRAYRLQCKAREIEVAGCVETVEMAPDPAASPVDAALYFRCRKCRQLLFTDGDVLQHELGEGRGAFAGRHRGKKGSSRTTQNPSQAALVKTVEREEPREKEGGHSPAVFEEQKTEEEEVEPQSDTVGGQGHHDQRATREITGLEREGETVATWKREDGVSEEVVLGGNPNCPAAGLPGTPWDHTPSLPTETERMRQEVGSLLAQRAAHALSLSPGCTSYFIEPVAWMGESLLGHLDGKILCPKCNCRLGSFSWRGSQCSCGQWLTPAFQVHRNRVDEVRTLTRRKNTDKNKPALQ